MDRLESILKRWPDAWRQLDDCITVDRAFRVFSSVAGTLAPSQLACRTRGPVLRDMAREDAGCGRHLEFFGNLWSSGAVALRCGAAKSPVWLMAHLDAISYSVQVQSNHGSELLPLCLHRIDEGSRPGAAVLFDPAKGLRVVARGRIVSSDAGRRVRFETDRRLPPGCRIVYEVPLEKDEETLVVQGDIDNAAGCAALYLAMTALAGIRGANAETPPAVTAVFPDEEEGVVCAGNQAFSRGSARLFNRAPTELLPELAIVSDVQGSSAEAADSDTAPQDLGRGAAFAEVTSLGKGVAVPPHLYAFQHELSRFLAGRGIRLRENAGRYLSRSDDVSAIMYTPNVTHIGYVGTNRHLSKGMPKVSLRDLVDLAKTLAVYSLIAQDVEWRRDYLGCEG